MERDTKIEMICQACLATMLDLEPTDIPRETSFASLGLDSAAAVHFVLEIEQALETVLYPGVTDDYPTIATFAAYIAGQSDAKQ